MGTLEQNRGKQGPQAVEEYSVVCCVPPPDACPIDQSSFASNVADRKKTKTRSVNAGWCFGIWSIMAIS